MRRVRACGRHAFPLIAVLLFVVLVAADLNGSSIGLLQEPGTHDSSLLHGTPRPVRSDEWHNVTPIQIGTVREGNPSRPYIGLTRTDQLAITQAGPRDHPLELFRPQDWGYFLLGVHRGFAWHWWLPYLLSLLGLYALSMTLALGRAMSAALAVLVTVAPYDAWWTAPSPATFVGLGCLSAAALITGARSGRTRSAVRYGCAAGTAFVAMSLALYPPWQLQICLVLAALIVGQLLDHRPDPRRVLITLGCGGAVTVVGLGWWYLTCRDAIRATADTIYPGHRVAVSGGASLARLLSAPLNPPLSRAAGATVHAPGNLSEVSASWLPLPLLAGCVLATALWWRGRRGAATAGFWTTVLLIGALAFLLAWVLFPVPSWAGGFLLSRSTPKRSPVALGLGSVVLLALVGRYAPRRAAMSVVWVVGGVLTVGCTWWSARHLPWDTHALSTPHVLALGLPTAIAFAAVAAHRRPCVAAAALAAYSVWSFTLVNPWYRGLGPLDRDPIVREMRAVQKSDPHPLVVVFGDSAFAAIARAAGVETLSGVTYFPDPTLMEALLPGQSATWNNYLNYYWMPLPKPGPASIERVRIDAATLRIHPCDPHLLGLHVDWVLSSTAVQNAPCLGPGRTFQRGNAALALYRVEH